MLIGIVGPPKSGKTTIFNALTRGHAETAAYATSRSELNAGVAKVPDPRLQALAEMYHTKRVVPAEVQYIDAPGPEGGASGDMAIAGEAMNALQGCDALLLVVRAFENPAVPHPKETVDPYRDAAEMELELAFADMAILERRRGRIQTHLKSAKATERPALTREMELLAGVQEALEREEPLRHQQLSPEAAALVGGYQFLTAKPLLIVFNIGEDALPERDALEEEMRRRLEGTRVEVAALCGPLETELSQMDAEEAAEFRESLGTGEPGLERLLRLSYRLVGLVSFLTAGEPEVRAWSIVQGTPAVQAAGKIHSDIERGFIRAELVAFDDLMRMGSLAEARRHGLLRTEGKQYVVRDGDVINFLFNV